MIVKLVVRQSPDSRYVSRGQKAMTSEDTEDIACVVVTSKVDELVRALQLLLVTILSVQ